MRKKLFEAHLTRIMEQNWSREASPRSKRWTFVADVRDCPISVIKSLVSLYAHVVLRLQRTSIREKDAQALKHGSAISLPNDLSVSVRDLAKFLHAMTLSEYALGSLVYIPSELRQREFEAFARSIGWTPARLAQVNDWWLDRKADRLESSHL